MVNILEIRDEYPDDSYPVVMEYCVNNNLDETHIYISEYDIENNQDSMKMVTEKLPDGHDNDENLKASVKNKGVIHRVINDNEKEINWDALEKLI